LSVSESDRIVKWGVRNIKKSVVERIKKLAKSRNSTIPIIIEEAIKCLEFFEDVRKCENGKRLVFVGVEYIDVNDRKLMAVKFVDSDYNIYYWVPRWKDLDEATSEAVRTEIQNQVNLATSIKWMNIVSGAREKADTLGGVIDRDISIESLKKSLIALVDYLSKTGRLTKDEKKAFNILIEDSIEEFSGLLLACAVLKSGGAIEVEKLDKVLDFEKWWEESCRDFEIEQVFVLHDGEVLLRPEITRKDLIRWFRDNIRKAIELR